MTKHQHRMQVEERAAERDAAYFRGIKRNVAAPLDDGFGAGSVFELAEPLELRDHIADLALEFSSIDARYDATTAWFAEIARADLAAIDTDYFQATVGGVQR